MRGKKACAPRGTSPPRISSHRRGASVSWAAKGKNMEPNADIALIGLAVMGQNLILNMNDHGFTVAAYNRTVAKVDEFINKEAKGTKVVDAHSIEDPVA